MSDARMLPSALDAERSRGLTAVQAVREACLLRFRPILMTTLAMIFGMVPLAFALTEGSEQRAPMGQAVIGGVITSSLLTLVVVPALFTLIDDLERRIGPRVKGWLGSAGDEESRPAGREARPAG